MNSKAQELEAILSRGEGERELCAFLKRNPWVLRESLQYVGTPTRVIAEFPLGSEHIADFVIVAPFSGAIEVVLIEVEPPLADFFTRSHSLSKRANKALEQALSWGTYIEKNRQQFLRDLERFATERDLIREHDSSERLTCTAGLELHHPRMTLFFTYYVIMGRRASLTPAAIEKKASFGKTGVSFVSCDRLFIGAEKVGGHPHIYE